MESNTRVTKVMYTADHWEGGLVVPFWGYRIRFGGKMVTRELEATYTLTTIDVPITPREMKGKKYSQTAEGLIPLDTTQYK